MNIVYVLKDTQDPTMAKIMEQHKGGNDVTVIDIRENKDYDQIIDAIDKADKVIAG
jgi:hypothetical protein